MNARTVLSLATLLTIMTGCGQTEKAAPKNETPHRTEICLTSPTAGAPIQRLLDREMKGADQPYATNPVEALVFPRGENAWGSAFNPLLRKVDEPGSQAFLTILAGNGAISLPNLGLPPFQLAHSAQVARLEFATTVPEQSMATPKAATKLDGQEGYPESSDALLTAARAAFDALVKAKKADVAARMAVLRKTENQQAKQVEAKDQNVAFPVWDGTAKVIRVTFVHRTLESYRVPTYCPPNADCAVAAPVEYGVDHLERLTVALDGKVVVEAAAVEVQSFSDTHSGETDPDNVNWPIDDDDPDRLPPKEGVPRDPGACG